MGGGAGGRVQKTKNKKASNSKTVGIKLPTFLSTFLAPVAVARAIVGAKKVSGPSKILDFVYGDHLESLKWPHLAFFKGSFHNAPPHLQHRDINS